MDSSTDSATDSSTDSAADSADSVSQMRYPANLRSANQVDAEVNQPSDSPHLDGDGTLDANAVPTKPMASAPRFDAGRDANRHQVALVVCFKGDKTSYESGGFNKAYGYGSSYKTQWDWLIHAVMNDDVTDSFHSQTLYSYIKKISSGSIRMITEFPQTDTTSMKVAYLELPHDRSYYESSVEGTLVREAVAAFNAEYPHYDVANLDGDDNGYLDNLLVIPELGGKGASSSNSPLWPHKHQIDSSYGLRLGTTSGVRVLTYTVVGSDRVTLTGVVVHETLHTLGAKDLYTSSTGNEGGDTMRPVASWDIMGNTAASKLPWTLAQTRVDMGMLTLPEKKVSGTYTLHAPGSGKEQAFIVRSPLSGSEFFVFEYRKKGGYLSGNLADLDSGIASSGLIVYRVDTTLRGMGNNSGEGFYIYIFRPGETNPAKAQGEVDEAYHSLNHNPVIGSADLNASFASGGGTIFCKSGANTGITAKVTSETSDSITFDLTLPDATTSGFWSNVGQDGGVSLPSAQCKAISLAAMDSGLVALVSAGTFASTKASVYVTSTGNTWNEWGAIPGSLVNAQVVQRGSNPTVIGYDPSAATIVAYERVGSNWQRRAANPSKNEGQNYISVARQGDIVYIAADAANKTKIGAYKYDGSRFIALPAIPTEYQELTNPTIFMLGSTPAVIATSYFGSVPCHLHVLRGSSWKSTMPSLDGKPKSYDVAQTGSRTFVLATYDSRLPTVLEFDDSGSLVGKPHAIAGAATNDLSGALASDGSYLYAGLVESGTSVSTRVLAAALTSLDDWDQLGGIVHTPATSFDLAIRDSYVFGGVIDSGSGVSAVRRYKTLAEGQPTRIAKPTAVTGLMYDGSAKTGVRAGAGYTVTGNVQTNAGNYQARVTPKRGYCWEDGSSATRTIPWSIAKCPLSRCAVSSLGIQFYQDALMTPRPSVTFNGKALAASSLAYRYTGNAGKTATGSVTVSASAHSNFTGSVTRTFRVGREMHRLYNPNSGEHFYTADVAERDHLTSVGWHYEGRGWIAPVTSGTPVYRLYNANAGDHHYTTSRDERDHLTSVGWKFEGTGWYSDEAQGVALLRQYNPNAIAGSHNYTTSTSENAQLVKLGWKGEGIGWYGMR